MELRVSDLLTKLFGAQSLLQFGASVSEGAQQLLQNDGGVDVTCDMYFAQSHAGYQSRVISVRDNLAVIPEQWIHAGVASHFLNAQTVSTCLTQIKDGADFISFDDQHFLPFLGRQATFETIHSFTGDQAEHVHEAPLYSPSTNELIFADTAVTGWLHAVEVDTHEHRTIETVPPLPNVNGGTRDGEYMYLTTNGSPTRGVYQCTLPTAESNSTTCTPIVNNYRLAHLNSPNDLIFDNNSPQSHMLFTDPTYGWTQSWPGVQHPELPQAVYHFNMTSKALLPLITTPEVHEPNGLAFSPDAKTLYVADSNSTSGKPIGVHSASVRNVYAFDYNAKVPSLRNRRLIYVCEAGWPDGLRVTKSGLVLVATMGGVDVVDPARGGRLIGKINVGDDIIFNLEPVGAGNGVWLLTGRKNIYKISVAEQARAW